MFTKCIKGENIAEVSVDETLESAEHCFCYFPGFWAIKKHGFDTAAEDSKLGLCRQPMTAPYCFELSKGCVAFFIGLLMSEFAPPSVNIMLPKYVNLSTSSMRVPLMLKSVVLIRMNLVFWMLISPHFLVTSVSSFSCLAYIIAIHERQANLNRTRIQKLGNTLGKRNLKRIKQHI